VVEDADRQICARLGARSRRGDREQLPRSRDAFEFVLASVVELVCGGAEQFGDCSSDDDFVRVRVCGDAGGDVD
jgi:hypothetical protein